MLEYGGSHLRMNLLCRGHWTTFLVVVMGLGCYGHLVGRGWDAAKHWLPSIGKGFHNKELPSLKCPWFGGGGTW